MKILHTSDWHLGRALYGRKRYEEFGKFLDWLIQTIEDEQIDALLVAGDVFDTSTPSNRAQELYYRFLCRVSTSCCRHVVVIAGNHDSPSFLNAPRELLRALHVYVVGAMTDNLQDEIVVLKNDAQGEQADTEHVEAIVCAVPYLRDRDVRLMEPGETIDDKNQKLVSGIKQHYDTVVSLAVELRNQWYQSAPSAEKTIPIIALGHLFTAGGKTMDGDGVRDLYVGSLAHVEADVFSSAIDYVALGHLHVPQPVGKAEHIRYCGSPIPMGYGEATQEKSVVIVEFNAQQSPEITLKSIPCFQQLVRITGSLTDIHERLSALKKADSCAWLEIDYTGSDIISNLRETVDEALEGSAMEVRRIKNRRVMDRVMRTITQEETLDDLDPTDVFMRCLDACEVAAEEREELLVAYHEIVKNIQEEDRNAE